MKRGDKKMEKIIAGLVQMDSGPDMNENMRMAEQYVREAAEQGAKLILFPETAEYTGADMPGNASAVPGYVSRRFSSLAKRYDVYLHCGSMTVRRHPGRPSNTSFLFGPDGETIAEYSKIHMFDVNIPGSVSYEESREICPGNEIVLADTALGLFGMSICYDIRFPEQYRLMAFSGADAFLIAADFTKATGERHWEALLRTRAIENGCYVLAANQCGQKARFEAYGHSMIIAPDGEILAEADDTPQVLIAELDPEVLERTRNEIPSLENRRDDLYRVSSGNVRIYEE